MISIFYLTNLDPIQKRCFTMIHSQVDHLSIPCIGVCGRSYNRVGAVRQHPFFFAVFSEEWQVQVLLLWRDVEIYGGRSSQHIRDSC